MLQITQAPKGAKLSDKFSVWVKQENTSWQSVSVYTALTPDGTSNGICFPDEIYKEFDGLPFGTMAKKHILHPLRRTEKLRFEFVSIRRLKALI